MLFRLRSFVANPKGTYYFGVRPKKTSLIKRTIKYDHKIHLEFLDKQYKASFVNLLKFIKKTDHILDVGCYTGGLLFLLKNKGFRKIEGLDSSDYASKIGEKNYGIKINVGSIFDNLNLGKLDFIILTHVLEHVEHPVEALEEIRRVLNVDGTVFVSVPNRLDIFGRLRAFLKGRIYESCTDPTHRRFYTLTGLVRDCIASRLRVSKAFGKSFIPLFLPKIISNQKFYRFLGSLPVLRHFTTGNMVIAQNV